MQENDGESAIEQQEDMAGQLRGAGDALGLECRAQPVLEFLFMRGAELDGRMPRHIGKFSGGAQEAAALPLRMSCGLCKIRENRLHLHSRPAVRGGEPSLE